MTEKNRYEIVYDSDFIIDDPVELSTLCVFYDKVWLPFSRTVGRFISHKTKGVNFVNQNLQQGWIREDKWEMSHYLFFDEGVIERLEIPTASNDYVGQAREKILEAQREGSISKLLKNSLVAMHEYPTDKRIFQEERVRRLEPVILHLGRSDIALPRLSTNSSKFVNREALKSLLAEKAFRYVLPALSELHPEQILEIRRKVAGIREGFSMHLQKLTGGIDARLKGGETFAEITKYAQNVFETELEPDYVDFKKLLGAEKVAVGGKVCSIVGSIFSAVAIGHPSPLLVALGIGTDLIAKQSTDSDTNERQAYHFMHLVEGADVNRK